MKEKRNRSAELDILTIHLERLFQETQKPHRQAFQSVDRKLERQARKAASAAQIERDEFEADLRQYSAQLAKNMAEVSRTQVFERKVTEELDTLMGRFKIYGI